MADYYPVLKRAIATLPQNTIEYRRAVYDKARAALTKQLNAFDPPLAAGEIGEQRSALEESIRKVEAEEAGVVQGGRARTRTKAELEAEAEAARAAEAATNQAASPQTPDATPEDRPGGADAEHSPAEPSREEAGASPASAGEETEARAEPAPRTEPPATRAVAVLPVPAARPSRLPAVAALTVLFFIMAGIGAVAWDNRDRLSDMFSGTPAQALPETAATVTTAETTKIEDRLPALVDTDPVTADGPAETAVEATSAVPIPEPPPRPTPPPENAEAAADEPPPSDG